MSARIKRAPMPAFEGFVFGGLLVVAVANLIVGNWGDSLQGALFAFLFWACSSERRRAEALQAHLNVVRRYQR